MLKSLLKDIFASPSLAQEQDKTIVDNSKNRDRWFEQLIVRMF
jgi:hypothetical protein